MKNEPCPHCAGTGWAHTERTLAPPVTGKRVPVAYDFVEECECVKEGR